MNPAQVVSLVETALPEAAPVREVRQVRAGHTHENWRTTSALGELLLKVPLHQRDPGGLGIHLMRQMTDRVEYRRTDGHNRLRIETVRR